MSTPVFEELIAQLGKELEMPLKVDRKMACRLHFTQQDVVIQIDLMEDGQRLLMASELGEIIPGPFRERFFKGCLKFNGAHQNRGIFAFSEKKTALVMFRYFYVNSTTPQELATFIKQYVRDIQQWKVGLTQGEIPHIETRQESDGGVFGIAR